MSQNKKKSLFKVVFIGDGEVGKTSLINQYVNQTFTQKYKPTEGSDFMSKDIMIKDKKISLQIWDTIGQEKFQSFVDGTFYRGADCCVLVYDITNKKSFESLVSWKEKFKNQGRLTDPDNFPFIVIGNKCDETAERKVETQLAKQWCASQSDIIHFCETSAKEGNNNSNFDEAFMAIAQSVTVPPPIQEQKIISPIESNVLKPDQPKNYRCRGKCAC